MLIIFVVMLFNFLMLGVVITTIPCDFLLKVWFWVVIFGKAGQDTGRQNQERQVFHAEIICPINGNG